MERNIEDEVRLIEAYIHGEQGKQQAEPEEEIYHVYDVPGGIVILREGEIPGEQGKVIDSIPAEAEPQTNIPTTALPLKTPVLAQAVISAYLLLILSCLMFQLYLIINPFTITVTLAAKEQQVSLYGTLPLGRVLTPITLSQSSTVPTTGKGHQDARQAQGTITFYNGQSSQITIPAGTILTGNDGVQIITDQDANIPPANQTIPPTFGQTTVSAHAKDPGTRGNISTGDINQSCCATSILVQNTAPFHGGQDERDFQTIAKNDIDNTATPLKATLAESLQGALQGQLKNGEQLTALPCTPTVTTDHQIGQEATTVKVTAIETCSGIAYNDQELEARVTQLLTAQAAKKLGSGYSILGNPQITVTSATPARQVTLSFTSVSTWIYALSSAEQRYIKKIIAGKTKEKATKLLSLLPGIERVSIQSSGFGDDTRIPKNLSNIHLTIFYGL